MFSWISDNAVTIIALAILLIVIGITVFSLIKDKKKKKGGCTGNCQSCGMNCSYIKNNNKM